jgi:DNA-binding response OmpR family regulator
MMASIATRSQVSRLICAAQDYVSKPFKATALGAKVAAIFQIQNRFEAACPAIP